MTELATKLTISVVEDQPVVTTGTLEPVTRTSEKCLYTYVFDGEVSQQYLLSVLDFGMFVKGCRSFIWRQNEIDRLVTCDGITLEIRRVTEAAATRYRVMFEFKENR